MNLVLGVACYSQNNIYPRLEIKDELARNSLVFLSFGVPASESMAFAQVTSRLLPPGPRVSGVYRFCRGGEERGLPRRGDGPGQVASGAQGPEAKVPGRRHICGDIPARTKHSDTGRSAAEGQAHRAILRCKAINLFYISFIPADFCHCDSC